MSLRNPELFQGIAKLPVTERLQRLQTMGLLQAKDIEYLQQGGIQSTNLAEKFIENVIGYFQLPLGVASYFHVDGIDYCIPMAVEETSIIAALSKTAKWCRTHGTITTQIKGHTLIGQLQIANVKNIAKLKQCIDINKSHLIDLAHKNPAASIKKRGGGLTDITVRAVDDMAIIHLHIDCCDAMGANIINQTLEFLKDPIEQCTGETIDICILSNLNDNKLTCAEVRLDNINPQLALKIEKASRFAESCPYRAATHNKGVMNGIDPVVIATGNDWRAVEAAIHAYACRNGKYQAITQWRYVNQQLIGTFEAPLIVGTVGGVTQLHPTAKMALRMLNVTHADELSRIIAAVGLVQNLGALRALTTDGIVKGHMKLHIDNLILNTNASADEIIVLKKRLANSLEKRKHISQTLANDLLKDIRQQSYC